MRKPRKRKMNCEQNWPSTQLSKGRLAYTRLSTTVMSPFTQLQLQKYDPTAWAAAVQCRISFFLFVYRSIPSWWYLKHWKSCTDKGRKIKAVFSSKSNLWQTFGEWLYILPFPVLQSIVLPHHGCTSGAPSRKFSCQIAPAVLQKASCSLLFLPKLSVLLGHMLPLEFLAHGVMELCHRCQQSILAASLWRLLGDVCNAACYCFKPS